MTYYRVFFFDTRKFLSRLFFSLTHFCISAMYNFQYQKCLLYCIQLDTIIDYIYIYICIYITYIAAKHSIYFKYFWEF